MYRGLLRENLCEGQWAGSRRMLEEAWHCGAGLTLWRREGRKEGRRGRIGLQYSFKNVLSRSTGSPWARTPGSKVPCLTDLNIFAMLRHQLGRPLGIVARVQHGSEFRAQQLGPFVSYTQRSRRSEMRGFMATAEGSRQRLAGGRVWVRWELQKRREIGLNNHWTLIFASIGGGYKIMGLPLISFVSPQMLPYERSLPWLPYINRIIVATTPYPNSLTLVFKH